MLINIIIHYATIDLVAVVARQTVEPFFVCLFMHLCLASWRIDILQAAVKIIELFNFCSKFIRKTLIMFV